MERRLLVSHVISFFWHIKLVQWTNGRGLQERNAESIELWRAFYDTVDESSPNQIPLRLLATILGLQLYGCAQNRAQVVDPDPIKSSDDAAAIVSIVQKHDPLSVVLVVCSNFLAFLNAKRKVNKSLKMFETHFDALVSKFRSHGDGLDILKPLISLWLFILPLLMTCSMLLFSSTCLIAPE